MPILAQKKAAEAVSQSKTPKLEIIKLVGDISNEIVFNDLVLVGTYFRAERTSGGIIRPQENVQEDEYQGKVGLVLKMGTTASERVEGEVNVGDWIVYNIKDGWAITINDYPCRLVPLDRIRMKITKPEVAF